MGNIRLNMNGTIEEKIEIRIDAEININGKISKCILTNEDMHSWEQWGLNGKELFERIPIVSELQKTLYENFAYQDFDKLEEDYERQREERYTKHLANGEEITK